MSWNAAVLNKLHSIKPSLGEWQPNYGGVFGWSWVNFQCRGVLLVWMMVGQGPIALAVGAGGGLFGHFFSHLSFLFSVSLSLGDGPI